jgi:hypothetical protein
VIPRAVVDSADLQRVMTAALQSMNEDYKDREFGHITKRRKLDKHGCNWRAPVVLSSDIREDDNSSAAATVIKNFQAEYNIE